MKRLLKLRKNPERSPEAPNTTSSSSRRFRVVAAPKARTALSRKTVKMDTGCHIDERKLYACSFIDFWSIMQKDHSQKLSPSDFEVAEHVLNQEGDAFEIELARCIKDNSKQLTKFKATLHKVEAYNGMPERETGPQMRLRGIINTLKKLYS